MEWVLVGAVVALVLFLAMPGLKRSWKRSLDAPKDWPAVLLPLGLVVLFVVLLVASVRA